MYPNIGLSVGQVLDYPPGKLRCQLRRKRIRVFKRSENGFSSTVLVKILQMHSVIKDLWILLGQNLQFSEKILSNDDDNFRFQALIIYDLKDRIQELSLKSLFLHSLASVLGKQCKQLLKLIKDEDRVGICLADCL